MTSVKYLIRTTAALWLVSIASQAQTITSATVTGNVTDPTGAVIAGATVTIKNAASGAVQNQVTDSSGQYRFPFLKPGDYAITARSAGMKDGSARLSLLIGQEQAVNLTLNLQASQQTVEVTGAADLLQTENANAATSFSEKEVASMPVNGGDITNIAFTTPRLKLNVGGGNTNFNVNGLPFSSALFTMNGADITEPY
jgi:hypothetical protein